MLRLISSAARRATSSPLIPFSTPSSSSLSIRGAAASSSSLARIERSKHHQQPRQQGTPLLRHAVSAHQAFQAFPAGRHRRAFSTRPDRDSQPLFPQPDFASATLLRAKRSALLYALQYLEDHEPDGVAIGDTLKGLSAIHFQLGEMNVANTYLQKALQKQLEFYGREDVPQVIDTLQGLAGTLGITGRSKEAVEVMERVLQAVIGLLGTQEHDDVVRVMRDMARAKGFAGQHEAKKSIVLRAADIQRRMYGRVYAEHSEYTRTVLYLASAHTMLGELEDASRIVDSIMMVLERRSLTREDLELISLPLLFTKALLEGEMGRSGEKQALLTELLRMLHDLHGPYPHAQSKLQIVDVALELALAAADNGEHEVARQHVKESEAALAHPSLADVPKFSPKGTVAVVYGKLGDRQTEARLLQEVDEEALVVEGPQPTATKAMIKKSLSSSLKALGGHEKRVAELDASVEAIRRDLAAGSSGEAQWSGDLGLERMGRHQTAVMLETLGEVYR